MTLDQISIKYGTDKSSKHHGYCNAYEKHLGAYRENQITLLEIGYGGYHYPDRGGESARMWLDYFTSAKIISVDLYEKVRLPQTDRFEFINASQDDTEALTKVMAQNNPDIIIDDASHTCPLTMETFNILFPLLKPGGWYIIEDIEGSFFPGWASGTMDYDDFKFPHPVNIGRQLINDVNARYIPNFCAAYPVESIHFHSNIIFINKKQKS
jgi:hypothetical protein